MQSKDPFIGRYPASDHQDLIQIVGPGGGVQWRLSQMSTTWFSGVGAPLSTAYPQALANNLYYDTLSGNVWQFNGAAWALLIVAPSGSYVSFEDDFTNQASLVFGTEQADYPGDQNWQCISTAADAVLGGSSPFSISSMQNPGIISMAPAASQGASLFRGEAEVGTYGAPLGALNSSSGWQMDCWFAPAWGENAPMTLAVRVGFCVGGDMIADAPSGGAWIEFDTANPDSSSGFVLRTVDNSASTYVPLGYAPPGYLGFHADGLLPWNHVTLLSPAPGIVVCKLIVQKSFSNGGGQLFSASVTSTLNAATADSYLPMIQIFDRGSSGEAGVYIDRFSYSAPTGRI